MAPTAKPNSDGLLARVNFPLYSVEMLSSRHCVVAGGGGTAKTGVANGFEIYEIHHNGKRFIAEEIVRYETGANAVMNCAVAADGQLSYLATGQESHCQLYQVNSIIAAAQTANGTSSLSSSSSANNAASNVRQRSKKPATSPNQQPKTSGVESLSAESPASGGGPGIVFDIQPGECTQTDFTDSDPLQRVVRIAAGGKLMATGGTDGHIRVWTFPRLRLVHDLVWHKGETDDLDFSPDGKRLVSIAKDGRACVTSMENGQLLVELQWTRPEGSKYLFKRCRFAVHEGRTGKCRLFTISNPVGRGGKQKGVLQQWDVDRGRLSGIVETSESLSALAVRDDGRFVAVGTMFTGSVAIYIAFSLQKVLNVANAHSMFVTGLEFLPVNRFGPEISSDAEAAVLSISVDNKVCVHSLKPRHSIPVWLAVSLIVLFLFITFFLCSIIGV